MGLFTKEKIVNKVCLIPVEAIHPNPDQPRKVFVEEELHALSESIAANGLLQPISLMKEEDGSYRIIAGERRFRACLLLGMEAVPSIICSVTDEDAAVLALIENIQRSDLGCFEEAAAIQKLIEKMDMTQEEAAKKLGKSQSAVANKLRLLRLPENIRKFLTENSLTERHARALLRLPEEQMLPAAQEIAEQQLNVAQTEALVEALLNPGEEKPIPYRGRKIMVVKDLRIFRNTVERALETLRESGIEAFSEQTEHDYYLEYIVRVSKESAYKKKKTS